jgi:hypothetical protein
MSLCLPVRPYVCLSVCPHATTRLPLDGFLRKFILEYFLTSLDKIQGSLKSHKKTCTLPEDLSTFVIIPRWIFLRMKNVSDRICREIKTHNLCSITYFRKSYRLWDNVEKYGATGQATRGSIKRRMRSTCWITMATDTLRMCIFIAFLRQWLRMRASARFMYNACLVSSRHTTTDICEESAN